jgi:hypothetical protein
MRGNRNRKWINIVRNHCELYFPGIRALGERRGKKVQVIIDKGLPTEKEVNVFYLCPICLDNFVWIENDQIFWYSEFDLDHFPPESVGGKNEILECKSCNSKYGHQFDYSIKDYLEFMSFIGRKNHAPVRGKMSLDDVQGRYNVAFQWNDNSLLYNLDNFKKYPRLIEGLQKKITQGEPFDINMRISFPAETLVHKAFLKAAYLYCFSKWGYEFSFSKVGRNIISVLDDKLTHPLPNLGVFKQESNVIMKEGLFYVQQPSYFKGFIFICNAMLRNSTEFINTFVIIPPNTPNAWEEMVKCIEFIPKGSDEFVLFNIDPFTLSKNNPLGYSTATNFFIKSM